MSAAWTPPAEAIEAGVRVLAADEHGRHDALVAAILTAARPALVAEVWDEGWSERATYDPSGWDEPLAPNPYRTTPTP